MLKSQGPRDAVPDSQKLTALPLDNPLPLCNPSLQSRASSERGDLTEVSKTAQKKVSGLMLKISRLLAPPIHPRVSTVAVPSALRLISRAGRDGALRSA